MTAVALPLRTRPIGDDGMGPDGPPPWPNPTPTKTLRIGHLVRPLAVSLTFGMALTNVRAAEGFVLAVTAVWAVVQPFKQVAAAGSSPCPPATVHSPRAGNARGRLSRLSSPGHG